MYTSLSMLFFSVCSRLPNVPHSYVSENTKKDEYREGDVIHFTCETGYISGPTLRYICTNTGWENPVGCGKPQPLSDGDTKISTKRQYRHGERVEYICQNYYIMEGTPYKTCENGKWTGQMRCLKPCTVNREDMSKHNIQFRYVRDDKLYSEHNDVIEFICTRGRPVGSLGMRPKCIEGVMHLPTCQ
uniref:Sushi domain-containing protein n=1 Tax=Neolamprologus brichardi TaxID=32507 RepID=A0A3Q4I3W1_NEOBR